MRECERHARKLYNYDPIFHNLVDMLQDVMETTKIDPNLVHDAVNLAADKRKPKNHYYFNHKNNGVGKG